MIVLVLHGLVPSTPLTVIGSIHVDSINHVDHRYSAPPIIDIDPLIHPYRHNQHDFDTMSAEIFRAAQTWGFFQVVNHSIPEQLESDIIQNMLLLFGSSSELKNSIRRSLTNSRGYADDELTKRQRDMKEVFDMGQPTPYQDLSPSAMVNQGIDGTNQWPDTYLYPHLHDLQPTVEEYFLQCAQLSHKLFQLLISPFLICSEYSNDTTTSYVMGAFSKHTSFMRLNYYPPVNTSNQAVTDIHNDGGDSSSVDDEHNNAEEHFGVSRHTDSGAVTVLLQVQ